MKAKSLRSTSYFTRSGSAILYARLFVAIFRVTVGVKYPAKPSARMRSEGYGSRPVCVSAALICDSRN